MEVVLISGASSGIGKELAYKYAANGKNLFLIARRNNILEEIKQDIENKYGVSVYTLEKDLSLEGAVKETYQYSLDKELQVTDLINNAGFGDYGKFIDSDINKQRNMVDLNISALVELSYYYLKDMKARNYGNILNVASVAAFIPGPQMSVYYASKAFVLSFTEALSEELLTYDIHVAALCPGPTKTDFEKNASVSFSSVKMQSVKEVVDYAYNEFSSRKKVIIIPGFNNRLNLSVLKFLPRRVVRKIINSIQSKFRK